MIKPGTVRTVLTIAANKCWPVNQLDVTNAFLHDHLDEQVYSHQPAGFVDSSMLDAMCSLSKSLYGLKQAPRAWFNHFAQFAISIGFSPTRSDSSLFVYKCGNQLAYLLLYVDDIILTTSSTSLLQATINKHKSEFKIKDMGALKSFLGVEIRPSSTGFFLSQEKYAGMSNCRSALTPVDTNGKLSSHGVVLDNPSKYRSLADALQYLTVTRLDLYYVVQQACLHMHDPRDCHLALIKRILRYVRGTTSLGLHLWASSSTALTAYTDADWAGCPDTQRSTSGYCVFFGESLVFWSSKRQPTMSRSSAEAEYRAVANVAAECIWLRQLLGELHCHIASAKVAFCDNVSAVYMTCNPVHHRQTKHIEIDIHFVRERIALGELRVHHVSSAEQFVDVMTKGLPSSTFQKFRSSLCIGDPSA
jgi:hypothetical protein